jgi:hypothetical protein
MQHIGVFRAVATVPVGFVGIAHCLRLLQVLACEAMQLQAQQDQHFSLMVVGDRCIRIHLLPTSNRQSGGRSLSR